VFLIGFSILKERVSELAKLANKDFDGDGQQAFGHGQWFVALGPRAWGKA
jgi:hypothetical protein